jgi:hypothetical protein
MIRNVSPIAAAMAEPGQTPMHLRQPRTAVFGSITSTACQVHDYRPRQPAANCR